MTTPQPLGSSYAYIPELDGLRAVSILLVVVSHAGLGGIVPGGFGVTLFFGISGFIITRLLLAEWAATGRIDFGAFYLRRAVRLYPALLAFIALSCLALLWFRVPLHPGELVSALFYGANYYRVWIGFSTVVPSIPSPFGVLWSLAIEEHFYLLFPLFLVLALRRGGFVLWVGLLILASLAWRLVMRTGCMPGGSFEGSLALCGISVTERIYASTDTRLDALLVGCLLAWLAGRARAPWVTAVLRHPGSAVLAVLMVLGSLLYRDPFFRDTWRYSVQSVAILFGLGALLFSPALGWARALLSRPPMLLIGRMSYVLYLTHWLALVLACEYTGVTVPEELAPAAWYLVYLPVTAVLTAALYWGIEKPAARLRRRLRHEGAPDRSRAVPAVP
ncbi:acyltransferase family protein [Roseomonas populi]|uniref:Acyltransferase n=1 Tax=Roseomonas populi TaxID=3121582 RepID=A0ABT1X2K0_9PROT|nr:acyltransferase [Roseomonas pecuniae]MCR0982328.1 acyltransferase [Roseomonas pecuniae]